VPFTTCRILRIGCRAGIRASRSTWLNSDPLVPRIATPNQSLGRVNHVPRTRQRADFFGSLLENDKPTPCRPLATWTQ
jgi:hypothetical protein